jgi:hypothetical protein
MEQLTENYLVFNSFSKLKSSDKFTTIIKHLLQYYLMGKNLIKLLLIIAALTLLAITAASVNNLQFPLTVTGAPELSSPSDWVKENQILVYPNKIILTVKDATWARFTDTNSMDPFFDKEANAIEIIPDDPDSINVGDIIAYKTKLGTVIHRVIEKDTDKSGIYYIVQGDNSKQPDPFEVRFNQIEGVVIAIIY